MKIKIGVIAAVLVMLMCSIGVQAKTYGSLSYEVINKEIVITDCDKNIEGELIIPDELENHRVTTIAGGAFSNCEKLTSIKLPRYLSSIYNFAFQNCTGLKSVEFNESLKSIGQYCFNNCTSLESITLQKYLYTIGRGAFKHCTGLKNAKIDTVCSIEDYAFQGCTGIESITLGTVWDLGVNVFVGCTSLENIEVIKYNLYFSSYNGNVYNKDRTELVIYAPGKKEESFVLPEGVKAIRESAFECCKKLKSVDIREAADIGYYAFCGCTSLEEIKMSDYLTKIREGAFFDCESLTNVVLPNSIKEIPLAGFAGCEALKSVTIPDSVTLIDECAFEYCLSLNEVRFSGDENDWKKITIGESNDSVENAGRTYFKNYTVTYVGEYCASEIVEEGKAASLPVPPEEYIYSFTVDGSPWDGKCVMNDTTVTVEKQIKDCDIVRVITPASFAYNKEEETFRAFLKNGVEEFKFEIEVAEGLTWAVYATPEAEEPLTGGFLQDAGLITTVYIKTFAADGSVSRIYPFELTILDEYNREEIDVNDKKILILEDHYIINYVLQAFNTTDVDGTLYIASYDKNYCLQNIYSERIRRNMSEYSSYADIPKDDKTDTFRFFFWGGESGMEPIGYYTVAIPLYPEY